MHLSPFTPVLPMNWSRVHSQLYDGALLPPGLGAGVGTTLPTRLVRFGTGVATAPAATSWGELSRELSPLDS